jgi:hypothetical protein
VKAEFGVRGGGKLGFDRGKFRQARCHRHTVARGEPLVKASVPGL